MLKTSTVLLTLFGAGFARLGINAEQQDSAPSGVVIADYGVDCTFPIHYKDLIPECKGRFEEDRSAVYEKFMQGCRDYYGENKGRRCDTTEDDRIRMSLRQPQSMVNYTANGYAKIRAPEHVMELLTAHWETNKDNKKKEIWPVGNIYVNHWESPTYMVSVEDSSLRGGGLQLKQAVWDAVKPIIEAWTGMEQQPTSQYGIRVYTAGAILSPHVDRLPLVSSCIINVDQDVDEPWVLEVIDRQGRAVNVSMVPGDMVLYESGSLIHARPFALKGRYYANIFIHFEPTGRPLGDTTDAYLETLDPFLPPYIQPGTPEASYWASGHPGGWRRPAPSAPIQQVFSPSAHRAAATGDLDRLKELAKTDKASLTFRDKIGWEPLHEAVRAGDLDCVKFLVEVGGADINSRTGPNRNGNSPLNLALEYLNVGDGVTTYLLSRGAVDREYAEEL